MRQQVHSVPGNILIFLVCMAAIVIFYVGLLRAEMAFAASGGPAEPAGKAMEEAAQEAAAASGPFGTDGNEGAKGAAPDAGAPKDRRGGQDAAPGPDEPPSVPAAGAESDADLTAEPQASTQAYVTTAHYLNVRADAHAKANILRTVQKGTLLMVTERLENGWLKLEHEGDVHGAYAVPGEPAAEPRVAVKPAPGPGREGAVREKARPASKSHEVISSSGLTKEEIAEILEGTELAGHGLEEAVLDVEDIYGINAYFTIAVMKLESGNGKSRLARVKNNLFGLNATGGNNEQAYSFETKADSVYKFGQIISEKYVAKGLKTIDEVGRKYCPANQKWADLIVRIMNSDRLKV